jgi:hypothetical protein
MFLTNIHREARLVGLLGLIQHSGVNSSFLKRLKHKIGVYLPVFRIRILIGSEFNQVGGSGSRRAKVTHKNRKSEGISCLEALDVLFCGLKVSHVAWTSFLEALGYKKFNI